MSKLNRVTCDPARLLFSILTIIAVITGHLGAAIIFALCASQISLKITIWERY